MDGLRAIAVIAVLVYHAEMGLAEGGFLGVEVFFVISGFLITSMLIADWQEHGRLDLIGFWQRRARRLVPATIGVIVLVTAYVAIFLPGEMAKLRGEAVSGLFYLTNWHLILDNQPYFQAIGRPSLLRHLWSLAVEWQFYLVWPLLLLPILKRTRRRSVLTVLFLAIAAGSAVAMALLYHAGASSSRLYYGSDMRASGLLVGAALAVALAPWARKETAPTKSRRILLSGMGWLALAGLVAVFWLIGEYSTFLYDGGFLIVDAVTAVAILAAVSPGGSIGGLLLDRQPFRYIGLRSYSIYLWHWPVFMLTRPQQDIALDGWALFAVRLAATLILAEASYRFVETPFRRGLFGRVWADLKSRQPVSTQKMMIWTTLGSAGIAGLVLLVMSAVTATPAKPPAYLRLEPINMVVSRATPTPAAGAADIDDQIASPSATSTAETTPTSDANFASGGGSDAFARGHFKMHTRPDADSPPSAFTSDGEPLNVKGTTASCDWLLACTRDGREGWIDAQDVSIKRPCASFPVLHNVEAISQTGMPAAPETIPGVRRELVTAIGDSVMLGAFEALAEVFPELDIDAAVNRQISAAVEALEQRRQANDLAKVVIIHMGNNYPLTRDQFEELMAPVSDVPRVLVVNLRVPRAWESSNNQVIAEGAARHDNVVLVDWYNTARNHYDYFWDDGVHLRPEGQKAYARLLLDRAWE